MAKNRAYRRRYVIEVRGITTNGFMARMLDSIFDAIVRNINGRKQSKVTEYRIEDMRTGGASELTPGGIQVNLMYKSKGD